MSNETIPLNLFKANLELQLRLQRLMQENGQQWLENREPEREIVARHLVNLAWNGLAHLETDPKLVSEKRAERRASRSPGKSS